MKYILEIENPENVRLLVMQDLKELGIKVPKAKKNKKEDSAVTENSHLVFGNFLNMVPCLMVEECGPVPKFLVQATHVIDKHIDIEGLFRKSGSVARQKELKAKIESGEDLLEANPLDVAGLIKQFFRELSDPLFTSRLHDTFIKCHSIDSEDARVTAILLLCHQLSWHHLSTLRYFMLFLQKVAHNCDLNKMDVANLAVCLTPNLMHNNGCGKSEKINAEGRLLQMQTNVVQILILWAGDIGMVPDSLYERACLMSACFPATDDELERSEAHLPEQSKAKGKKKRRSGSLQGLVSNLSTSFSKWRKDTKAHNASSISDRSTMSYMSFEKSSLMSVDQTDMSRVTVPTSGPTPEDYSELALIEATPKVIRKRKAEDDAVPFSASKKKAILQNMPQMSALGSTPFTPTSRRGRFPGDFQETPNIKFADAENMIFSANATPNMQTPKRKMDKLFTPYTSTKVKRQSSGKSGCFSPKTSKSNMRKSVRGFFRRLSGGKEPLPSPSSTTSSGGYCPETGQKMGVPDSLLIMDPAAGHKKRTFFRRHKKTPSSPARLVSSLTAELQRDKAAMASRGSSMTSVCQDEDQEEGDNSFDKSELASRLGSDLNLMSPLVDGERTPVVGTSKIHRSDLSLDTTNTSLRRGKPNTVKSGLHEYYKRRSLDVELKADGEENGMIELIETVPNTIDTSPILKEGAMGPSSPEELDLSHTPKIPRGNLSGLSRQSSGLSCLSRESSQISLLSQQSSKTSLLSLCAPAESGLDQAFINESMILADTTHGAETTTSETSGEKTRVKVSNTDSAEHGTESTADKDAQFSVRFKYVELDSVAKSEGCDKAASSDGSETKQDLAHQPSVNSIDSAMGSDSTPESSSTLGSLHSLQSFDSGVGIRDSNTSRCHTAETASKFVVRSDSNLTGKSRSHKVRRRSAEPNLHLSADMQSMLSKAGHLDDSSVILDPSQSHTDYSAEPVDSKAIMRESVLELHKAGKVSTGKQQYQETVSVSNTTDKRKDSPLRFSNSIMRRNPEVSPLRIPTIFAKNDKDASHYRDLAKSALSSNSKTASIRRPNLPITSQLVRGNLYEKVSLKAPISNTEEARTPETGPDTVCDTTAGHTPARFCLSSMKAVNFDQPLSQSQGVVPRTTLCESNSSNISSDPLQATPKIKPTLLGNANPKLTKPLHASTCTNSRKYRSPMKPVKRLQGSPISPHGRRASRSPKNHMSPHKSGSGVSSKPRFSPLPTQSGDWDI